MKMKTIQMPLQQVFSQLSKVRSVHWRWRCNWGSEMSSYRALGKIHRRFNEYKLITVYCISIESIISVIRLLRVARVARKMDHFAEYSGVVLILLVGAFVLFGHWLACMWFAIGKCVRESL